MGKQLIVGNDGCEHDNTEDFIEALERAGELSADKFGTPLTRHTYQGRVVIKPSGSLGEARSIVRSTMRDYNIRTLKVRYV